MGAELGKILSLGWVSPPKTPNGVSEGRAAGHLLFQCVAGAVEVDRFIERDFVCVPKASGLRAVGVL